MKYGGEALSPEAAAICQVLLNHQRVVVGAEKRPPFQACLLTYRDLCDEAQRCIDFLYYPDLVTA